MRVFLVLALISSAPGLSQKAGEEKQGRLLLSNYYGHFEAFLRNAVRTGKTAVIDEDFRPGKTIVIKGSIVVPGETTPNITTTYPNCFAERR